MPVLPLGAKIKAHKSYKKSRINSFSVRTRKKLRKKTNNLLDLDINSDHFSFLKILVCVGCFDLDCVDNQR